MFCSKCGQQIPDNASFCNKCGAKATANPAPQPQSAPAAATANTTTQPSGKQQPKKKGSFLVTLIVVAAAFLIGKYLLAPGMVSTPANTPTIEKSSTISAAYSEIFSSRHIVRAPHIFVGMDSSAYAIVDEDGMIEDLEFGYSGDLIKEMVDTIYYPISDLSADEIPVLDESMKEVFSAYELPGVSSVSYSTGNNYYIITITCKKLDNSTNIQKLSELGILETTGSGLLSMYQTESALLANGYVKK
ncbi:MAG: zinc-ribbon domain-containing protein [Clostridiales bacterium]|nr:zinc-ribbon domain-containing protein [Clostridiales bacterium]